MITLEELITGGIDYMYCGSFKATTIHPSPPLAEPGGKQSRHWQEFE